MSALQYNECEPGGCSAIGCEGGRYCFRADGSRIKAPDFPRDLFKQQVDEQIAKAFPSGGPLLGGDL
jgi:hypothetical protein